MTDRLPEPEDERFQRQLDELAAKADQVKAPKLDDEYHADLDERLREIEKRAKIARGRQEVAENRDRKAVASDRESYRGLGFGLSIAYTIIGLPLFGFGVGWLIDRNVGGQVWQGMLMLTGAVVGIGFAFYQLNRSNS